MKSAIRTDNLGKLYSVPMPGEGSGRSGGWRSVVPSFGRGKPKRDFWALREFNLNVNEGETIGIIGRNGAGKSTLLKLLSQITSPTTGSIELRGAVGALLEVGTGFHRELSGRENTYMSGSLFGMRRREIAALFDEIVDFAGVGDFIDMPFKHYSSGMQVRLGFSVAAHLRPEILLIDEVLAVGDANFQRKCLSQMGSMADRGRTVLFVSHNLGAVRDLCPRTVWIDDGIIKFDGPTEDAVSQYLSSIQSLSTADLSERTDRTGKGNLRFSNISLAARSRKGGQISTGDDVEIRFEHTPSTDSLGIAFTIVSSQGSPVASFRTDTGESPFDSSGVVKCNIPSLPLSPGTYTIDATLVASREIEDHLEGAAVFSVHPGIFGSRQVSAQTNPAPVAMIYDWVPGSGS